MEHNSANNPLFLVRCVCFLVVMAALCCWSGCSDPPSSGGGGNAESNGDTSNTSNGTTGSGTSNGVACVDVDGDGFGQGCALGVDCNDADPAVQACDCAEGDFAGCPCEGTETKSCYDGDSNLVGVGICRDGVQRCEDGAWTACLGQILPTAEVCNNFDDDCDGQVNNGAALNACGNCDLSCTDDAVGSSDGMAWGLDEENVDGAVEVNDEGGLELASEGARFDYMWIANDAEGTVSKIDTRDGKEVGRYISALPLEGLPDPLTACDDDGNCPSRTAVDLRGDVWVANRAFDLPGSVTKIAHQNCIDRNEDGVIQTSKDVDGDGRIDINDSNEFFGASDECVLFTSIVGGEDGIPRALAIDPFAPVRGVGSVWVGLWNERRYYQLDASDGSLIQTVDVPHQPYGAVMDRFGTLWSVTKADPDQGLVSITSSTGEVAGVHPMVSTTGCADSYGVAIDGMDNIWVAGRGCAAAYRFTPSNSTWATVDFGFDGNGRGIAVDREGWVYVGISAVDGDRTARMIRFRGVDGGEVEIFDAAASGTDMVGVGLDSNGRVWGVNRRSDNAVRVDPNTGQMEFFPTGPGPYTYSDFTGFSLRNFTSPQGAYRHLFTGCPNEDSVVWDRLNWDADTPVGTAIEFRIKSADSLDGLVAAPQLGPFQIPPVDLQAEGIGKMRYVEVEATLLSNGLDETPILWSFNVTHTCPSAQ